jgi:hypothetical protein
MSKQPEGSSKGEQPSAGLTELIGRALTDVEFRERLAENRKAVAPEFELSERDLEALQRLDMDEVRRQAERLGGRASITIKVVITKSF